MSLKWWGVAPVLTLVLAGGARAGDLDRRLNQQHESKPVLYQLAGGGLLDDSRPSLLDSVPIADLQQVADFHPETDRWTERNNRIRISVWSGAWLFSGELDIHGDVPVGFRIAWEVPGFIGIRWDSGFVPWSRLQVRVPTGSHTRSMNGWVHAHTLSLGIFNPELSVDGLAFWAGFGGGVWVYDYREDDVFGRNSNLDYEFSDMNLAGNIFVELDYKIADVFHISLGLREHVLLADHTDEGRFWQINDADASKGDGRNDGMFDDLASVFEVTISLSILF